MTRHFLRDDDLTQAEQTEILDLAETVKADRWGRKPLAGPQTVAVIFDKSSTRTRVSFAVGIADLGGSPLIISTANSQLGGKETPSDTARVLERLVAAIVWRTYAQSGLEEMAAGTRVPVVNALSDDFHPCQLLADLLTIREHKGRLAGLTVAFLGDGASNMAHSYLLAGATAGMHVRVACPEEFSPAEPVVADADRRAAETGGSVTLYTDPVEAVAGADVVVTDTWVSMGKEDEKAHRVAVFGAYQVTHRAHVGREGRRDLPALPARRPRLRGRSRGHRRTAERHLGRGGEPPARPEGAAGVAAGAVGVTQRVDVSYVDMKLGSLRMTENTVAQKMIAAITPTDSGTQKVTNFLTSMKIETPTVARYSRTWLRIRIAPADPGSPFQSAYPGCWEMVSAKRPGMLKMIPYMTPMPAPKRPIASSTIVSTRSQVRRRRPVGATGVPYSGAAAYPYCGAGAGPGGGGGVVGWAAYSPYCGAGAGGRGRGRRNRRNRGLGLGVLVRHGDTLSAPTASLD